MGNVGVILPAFRQPNLLIEATIDVLRQKTSLNLKVFIADDACDFEETARVTQALALTDPRIMICPRRVNGGLSANRNTSIAYSLASCPDLEAVTFLDADDRLDAGALQWFYDNLMNAPEPAPGKRIGWVYTDPYQFGGMFGYLQKPAEYSPLWHLLANSNSATSLISVEMLRAGCRFDETMRKGSEDWDFWLQAIRRGFYGKFVSPPTFRYRRRPESMTSDAKLYNPSIRAYVAERNADLYSEDYILSVAAHDGLRYALFDASDIGKSDLRYFTNKPGRWASGFEAFVASLSPERRNQVTFSPTIIVIERKKAGASVISPFVHDDVFAMAERALTKSVVVTVRRGGPNQARFAEERARELSLATLMREKNEVCAIFMRTDAFIEASVQPERAAKLKVQEFTIAPNFVANTSEPRACEITLAYALDRANEASLKRPYAMGNHPKWAPLGVTAPTLVNFLTDAEIVSASLIERDHAVLALDPRLLDTPNRRKQIERLCARIRENASLTLLVRADLATSSVMEMLVEFGDRAITFSRDLVGANGAQAHYLGASVNAKMMNGYDREVAGAMMRAKLLVIVGFIEMFSNAFLRRKKGAKVWALNLGEDDACDAEPLYVSQLGHAIGYEHTLDAYLALDERSLSLAAARGMPRDKLGLLSQAEARLKAIFARSEKPA